jgi:hypothetical protein
MEQSACPRFNLQDDNRHRSYGSTMAKTVTKRRKAMLVNEESGQFQIEIKGLSNLSKEAERIC